MQTPNSVVTPFTHWARSMDDGSLELWQERDGVVSDVVTIDVSALPSRSDLLKRLAPAARARLLWEAREVGKGNLNLNPDFPGYDPSPIEEVEL